METTQLPSNVSLPTPKQSTTLAEKVNDCITAYGDANSFSNTFAPVHVERYSLYPSRCVLGTAPTLRTIAEAYGEAYPIQWLMTLFIGVSEFSGAKDKITPHQLRKLAYKFYSRYFYFKVTEVMLFIDKLEAGDFGKFSWATFDPVAVLEKVSLFNEYRGSIYDKEDQRILEEKMAQWKREASQPPQHVIDHLKQLAHSFSINPQQNDNKSPKPATAS